MKSDLATTPPQTQNCDNSATIAQLELFIRLGMSDLDPKKHFAGALKLGNALIAGELAQLQEAMAFYTQHIALIYEHIGYLKRAFSQTGVSFQEPSVLHYEGALGQARTAIVISIVHERSGKVAFISSDPSLGSYVHQYVRNHKGLVSMEPIKDDPEQFLQQVSRAIRMPAVSGPPPMS